MNGSQQEIARGIKYLTSGDLSKAETVFQGILRSEPDHSLALHFLGTIRHQQGANDKALDLIKKALVVRPDFVEALNNLGTVYKTLGRYDAAADSYRKALAIKPNFVDAHFNLGNLLKARNNFSDAAESYRKALAARPDFVEAHYNLANSLKQLGQPDDAITSYRNTLAIKPDYAEAHNNLGTILHESGNVHEAVSSYQKALTIKSDYAEACNNLATALMALGRFNEAIGYFHKAIALGPDVADAHDKLAATLCQLGRLREAVTHYRQSLAIEPDNRNAWSGLGLAIGALDQAAAFRAATLECLYRLNRVDDFYQCFEKAMAVDEANVRIARVSALAAHQLGRENTYPFCKTPLDFIRVSTLRDRVEDADGLIDDLVSQFKGHDVQAALPDGGLRFQAHGNLFLYPKNSLAKLQRIIEVEIRSYFSAYKSADCLFAEHWPQAVRLNGGFVRTSASDAASTPVTPSGWLSGIVYLKTPETLNPQDRGVEFGLFECEASAINNAVPKILIHPEKAQIILFPSSLVYKSAPVPTGDEQLTIAFDLLAH